MIKVWTERYNSKKKNCWRENKATFYPSIICIWWQQYLHSDIGMIERIECAGAANQNKPNKLYRMKKTAFTKCPLP